MSACAAVFYRDGKPAQTGELEPLLDTMAYRGEQDFCEAIGPVALGFQHRCVLPEDEGVHWPLWDMEHQACIIFDGRLDNRDEVIRHLGRAHDFTAAPDAALVLESFLRKGVDCLSWFIGPFAFIIYQPNSRTLTIARDPLGDRRLCYTMAGQHFIVASEEQSLLASPEVEFEIEPTRMALYFAKRKPIDDTTFFKRIYDLLPGHWMRVTPERVKIEQYWQFHRNKQNWHRSQSDLETEFRHIMETAVAARQRGPQPVSILLSGGVDSTSIMAASVNLARKGKGSMPLAASYIFERFHESDESRYLDDLERELGLEGSIRINGDCFWPLSASKKRHCSINEVFNNPLAELAEELFKHIHSQGGRIVLSGEFGDHLYMDDQYWLVDLITTGQLIRTWHGLRSRLAAGGPRRWLSDPVLRRLFPLLGVRRNWFKRYNPWLTPKAIEMLPVSPHSDRLLGKSWQQDRFEGAVNLQNARHSSFLHSFAQRSRLDLRMPYRDLRVVEFLLNLPAYYSYNFENGLGRLVVRGAFKDTLPSSVFTRRGKSICQPLFEHGLYAQEKKRVEAILSSPGSMWSEYVDKTWLQNGLSSKQIPSPMKSHILWLCISHQLWLQKIETMNRGNSSKIVV